MKKIVLLLVTLCMMLSLVTVVSAEEATVTDSITEEVVQETIEPSAQTVEQSNSEIDIDQYSEQFVSYIFSGSEGSTELMNQIITMGEQYQLSKEQGYTFKERVNQLLTPENITTTIAAAFLLICGVAFFIFRRRQKIDTAKINKEVTTLKKKYQEEIDANIALRDEVLRKNNEIKEIKQMLSTLTERSDNSKKNLGHVEHTAVAVAKMVKDVFLNSKTIDASGKALVVHNYLEVLGKDAIASESEANKNE